MQKGSHLQFCCTSCEHSIPFNVLDMEKHKFLTCEQCQKKYSFTEEILIRQIKKFAALCYQIKESEEILSQTSIGIDVGERKVRVPYKLLLTRLTTHLDLVLDGNPITITFRIEPTKDLLHNDFSDTMKEKGMIL
jgi:transcription elongation factor Elf1